MQNEETRRQGDWLVGRKVMRFTDHAVGEVVSVDFYDPRDGSDITVRWPDGSTEKTNDNNSAFAYVFD